MGVFGATVPREMYDDMKRARDMWQQECSARTAENMELMKEILAMKRHELGAHGSAEAGRGRGERR
jgi:hypothetical protein